MRKRSDFQRFPAKVVQIHIRHKKIHFLNLLRIGRTELPDMDETLPAQELGTAGAGLSNLEYKREGPDSRAPEGGDA